MSKNNSVEIAYQNAKDLIHKKDYIQASQQLNEILKVFPNELNSITPGEERLSPKGSELIVCAHSTGEAHSIDAPIPATNIIAPQERLLKTGLSFSKIFFVPIGRTHNINKKTITAKAPSSYIFSSLILAA